MDLLLEAGAQFAVVGDQRQFGFGLANDGFLRGKGCERNWDALNDPLIDLRRTACPPEIDTVQNKNFLEK